MRPWLRYCRLASLVLALLVVGSGVAVAAGPSGIDAGDGTDRSIGAGTTARVDSTAGSASTTDADPTIELRQELRLAPDRQGEYVAHHRYRIPDGVVRLTVRLPPNATVTDASGFERAGDDTYTWRTSTRRPTLTYRVPANRTVDREDPISAPGRYMYVDVGEWGLVLRPQTSHEWGWIGVDQVRLERDLVVDGEGTAGEAIAFLGPHETYTRTAHGQTFRLVVPEAATLAEDPDEILDSLEHASDVLRVGSRHREVFVVAAPTGEVEWGVRGLQTARADVWVRDTERLDVADNVWLHEYAHARQGYTATDDLRWFTEGSAVFYAALLTVEQGRIDFDAFRRRLAGGNGDRFDGVLLADRATWRGYPEYYVGALVAGELDRQMRLSTDAERSLQDTLRRMNEEPAPIDAARFVALLRADGGDTVADLGDRYARTTERPAPWDATAHVEAFGTPLPRVVTTVEDAYRVDGRYRTATLAEPVVVVPGETLSVDVRLENAGVRTGDYDVAFRVDGAAQDRRSGRIDPGESVDLTFDHGFDEVGEYELTVGETTLPVRVSAPARARVTDFSVDRADVQAGESVTLTVVVQNGADRPGRLDLPVTLDGEHVVREEVLLGPRDTATVTVERTLAEPGEYVFGLGGADERQVFVTVTPRTIWRELPGFGPVSALLALLLLAIGGARRD